MKDPCQYFEVLIERDGDRPEVLEAFDNYQDARAWIEHYKNHADYAKREKKPLHIHRVDCLFVLTQLENGMERHVRWDRRES